MTQAAEDFNNEEKNEISKREDIKNIMELKVTFLCIVYVETLAITGGEDGVVIFLFVK